jgi:hypothetical protein
VGRSRASGGEYQGRLHRLIPTRDSPDLLQQRLRRQNPSRLHSLRRRPPQATRSSLRRPQRQAKSSSKGKEGSSPRSASSRISTSLKVLDDSRGLGYSADFMMEWNILFLFVRPHWERLVDRLLRERCELDGGSGADEWCPTLKPCTLHGGPLALLLSYMVILSASNGRERYCLLTGAPGSLPADIHPSVDRGEVLGAGFAFVLADSLTRADGLE